MLLRLLINVYRYTALQKRDGNSHVLEDIRREILLKAVGKPLSIAKRV
jgi:hypothetical protein